MKIIGKTDGNLLCEVSRGELEQFFNLYYGKMRELKIGEEIDLGRGYRYDYSIAAAMRATQELIKTNQTVVTAILNGLQYANLPTGEAPPPQPTGYEQPESRR